LTSEEYFKQNQGCKMKQQKSKLQDSLVLITGAGYRESQRIFSQTDLNDVIDINGVQYKLNIGAATARHIASLGAEIVMMSSTQEKLNTLKTHIINHTNCNPELVNYHAMDLTNEREVKNFFDSLNTSKQVWLVHSVGLGSQSYTVENDNPYLSFKNISGEMVAKEFDVTVNSLLLIMKNMETLFHKQCETRIAVITSMSGVRPFIYGYSHTAAKAGAHHAVRSLCLELSLNYKSVYVTEILPGMVDTGLYDSDAVVKTVQKISESFGFFGDRAYEAIDSPVMPPSSVAEAVGMALQSKAHILSVNLVGQGQFTNMGA
jgi:short-subunit dehydrogenase